MSPRPPLGTQPGARRLDAVSVREVGGGHRYYACRSCDAVVYRPDHREAGSHPMQHPSAPAEPLAGRGRGSKMGECTFTVHSGNHRAALDLRQWLPASAITPQRN